MAFAPAAARAEAAAADTNQIEEVVVTAQKREENLQDVPIAITAISGETAKKSGLTQFYDLGQYIPSFTADMYGDARAARVTLRGVASVQDNPGKQSSVGVFIDGVFMARTGMGASDLLDIERMEVLRGPQGTLFGMNTAAGLINIVTKKPDLHEFHGYGEAVLGNYDRHELRGNITGPIIDGKLGFGLSGYTVKRDGLLYNSTLKRDVDSQSKWAVRGKLSYVGENFDAVLVADTEREDSDCCAYLILSARPSVSLSGVNVYNLIPPGAPWTRVTANSAVNQNQHHGGGVSLEMNYNLGDFTLTSVTAWRKWRFHGLNDTDSFPIVAADNALIVQNHDQVSQELRITSPAGEKLEYVGGLFYFERLSWDYERRIPQGPTATQAQPGTNGQTIIIGDLNDVSYAVFGNVTYHFTDQLTGSAGARYTREVQDADFTQTSQGSAFVNLGRRRDTLEEGQVTWSSNLNYKVTPDVMVYGSAARGFKPSGFDLTRLRNFNNFKFKPETNLNFEFGVKSTLFDRRMILNVAAYHTDYNNFQTSALDGVFLVTTNAKKFVTQGIEIETTIYPATGLVFQGAAGFADARYRDFKNAACLPGIAGACDLTGRRLQLSPRYTASASMDYRRPIGVGDWTGFTRVEYSFRSSVYSAQNLDEKTRQDAFSLVNARIGVESANGLKVELWARNIFDKDWVTLFFGTPGIGGGIPGEAGSYSGFLGEPRMVGARIAKTF
jgi:iron complex outermembrane receptor protein